MIIEGRRIEPEDIEDALLESMSAEFGTILEDGSEVQIARDLCRLYRESIRGETALLDQLERRQESSSSRIAQSVAIQTNDNDDSIEEDEDMEESSSDDL